MTSLSYPLFAAAALLITLDGARAAELPSGRYRCYVPPSYAVTAWFDIHPEGRYQFQGEAPTRFAYDSASRRLTWIDGELASSSSGASYHPPEAGAPASQRHTIVLHAKPGESRSSASECYLTTH